MSDVSNAVAAIVLLGASVVMSVLTMINGYGVHIVSWGWLIWGFIAQVVLLGAIGALKD
jgi:hypothetical protein